MRRTPGPGSLVRLFPAMLLAGVATVILGPALPMLRTQWNLSDFQCGILLAAQSSGSFLGSSTVTSHLKTELIVSIGISAFGLSGLAFASNLAVGFVAASIMGFGLSRAISTINLIACRVQPEEVRSVTMILSLAWSIGATIAPLYLAALNPKCGLRNSLLSVAILLSIQCLINWPFPFIESTSIPDSSTRPISLCGVTKKVMIDTILAFSLYGGLEASLYGWMATFALRFGGTGTALPGSTTSLLLGGLTLGRFATLRFMSRLSPQILITSCAGLTTLLLAMLWLFHSGPNIASLAFALGVSLSPIYSTLLARLIDRGASPRQVGIANASSGIGAALLNWSVGAVSSKCGSLLFALAVPISASLALLALSSSDRQSQRLFRKG